MAKNLPFNEFKQRIINKFGDHFDFSIAEKEYKNFATPITFICLYHGPFIKTPRQFLDYGCKQCSIEKRVEKKTEHWKHKFEEKYKDNPYKINFSEFVAPIRNDDDCVITIYCEKHGKQEVLFSHLRQPGVTFACPECNKEYLEEKFGPSYNFGKRDKEVSVKKSFESFLRRAKEIHGDKYDYSLVPLTYKNLHSKIQIICPKHGAYWCYAVDHLVGSHTTGSGCPNCGNEQKAIKRRISFDEFVARARKVHGDKYDYSIVEKEFEEAKINNQTIQIITIKCKTCGQIFKQNKGLHMDGRGCPFCEASSKEQLLHDFLESIGVKYLFQATFSGMQYKQKLSVDFYLPEYDVVIEYNGKQHYQVWKSKRELELCKTRDFIKKKFLENHNIQVVKYSFKEGVQFAKKNLIRILRTRTPSQYNGPYDNILPITPFYKRFNRKRPSSVKYSLPVKRKINNLSKIIKKEFKNVLA